MVSVSTAFGCPVLSRHMCFVLIRLLRSEPLSLMCLLWRGLIQAVLAQGMKPTELDQQQEQQRRLITNLLTLNQSPGIRR